MRRRGKQFAVLWMAIFVSVLMGMNIPATAVKPEERTRRYRIDLQQPYLYGSRCQCAYTILDDTLELDLWTGWNAPEIWNLTEEGTGRTRIPAYQLTADPVDLEDMTGLYRVVPMDSEDESRLREILLRSVPYLSTEEIENEVNRVLGSGTVSDLTEGEAISAAQQAIWKIRYGDRMVSRKTYVSLRGISEYQLDRFVYPDSLKESREQSTTVANIRNLYQYYLTLDVEEDIVLHRVQYDAERTADGRYRITVTVETDGFHWLKEGLLEISCGQIHQCAEILKEETAISLHGLEEPMPVKIRLKGRVDKPAIRYLEPVGDGPVLVSWQMEASDVTDVFVIGPEMEAEQDRVFEIAQVHNHSLLGDRTMSQVAFWLMILGMGLVMAGLVLTIRCLCRLGRE